MGSVILYGLIIAHVTAYRNQYMRIGIIYACTFVFKRVVRAGGNKEHADLLGLGGYILTAGAIVELLIAMKGAGFTGDKEGVQKVVGGLLGDVLKGGKDFLKHQTQNADGSTKWW